MGPDGKVIIKSSTGSSWVRDPDGTTTMTDREGNTVVDHPDGSTTVTDASGRSQVLEKPGQERTIKPSDDATNAMISGTVGFVATGLFALFNGLFTGVGNTVQFYCALNGGCR